MYAVVVLQLTLVFSFMVMEQVKTAYVTHGQNDLDFVEIAVITKVKNDLLAYEEEDESYTYKGYEVTLRYEDITCFITIKKGNELLLSSRLEFDDIEEEFISYTYMEK